MSKLSVDPETKERFQAHQGEDDTQDEFVRTLLNSFEQREAGINPERWAEQVGEQIAESWANKVELGSYRGAKSALEDHHD